MAMRSSITHSSKRRRRKPILLIGGDKGGVGKSFGARAMVAWLRKNHYALVGFDGDGRNGHLERYYASTIDVDRFKLRDALGWSLMFKAWQKAPDDHIILTDLPGNVGDMVEDETDRLKRFAEALDRDIINIWVADEEEDSVWLLKTALAVADASRTLFWMNGRFAPDAEAFELWQGSDRRADFLADGGIEAFLPLLPIFPRIKIRGARCPFDDVSKAGFDHLEQTDFDIWWESLDQSLAPFAKLMEKLA